jgi:hypothetical protein
MVSLATLLVVACTVFFGGSWLVDHSKSNQDRKDVITYNDGFIDGENSILDRCVQISIGYQCPDPAVKR